MPHPRSCLRGWPLLLLVLSLLLITSELAAQTGSIGGFTWGSLDAARNEKRLGREELIAREGYCPTGGCVLRLDAVEVHPNRARRGGTVLLLTTYTLLTPEQIAIPVTITREISFRGKSLGRTRTMESRRLNGTWTQKVDFTLPATAAPGEYTLTTKVTTGYGTAEKVVTFWVE
jgi:hypothetical protein